MFPKAPPAVLHTWGQTLSLHPHLHLMATGGGLACDARGVLATPPVWKSYQPGFFLPMRVLSRLFRGKFLAGLSEAYQQGKLRLAGSDTAGADPRTWSRWLAEQRSQGKRRDKPVWGSG